MAFPTTPILDSGVGADASPATGWTDNVDGTSYGGIRRTSNTLGSISGDSWDYWSANTSIGPNVEVYATFPAIDTSQSAILYARMASLGSGSVDGYHVQVIPGLSRIQVRRVDNNAETVLGSNITQAFAAGDSLGMAITGSTIEVWYKAAAGSWTSLGTRTDATYSAAGGLAVYLGHFDYRMTNFGGGVPVTANRQRRMLLGVG